MSLQKIGKLCAVIGVIAIIIGAGYAGSATLGAEDSLEQSSYPYEIELVENPGEVTAETFDQRTIIIQFSALNESAYRCAYETYPTAFENKTAQEIEPQHVIDLGEDQCGLEVRRYDIR